MDPNPRMEGTKQAILERLLPGERHVLDIVRELRIRESAIRRHFDQLERNGYVTGFFRKEGLGRPKKYYQLTETGRQKFPNSYAAPLRDQLQKIVDAGRAPNLEEAVMELARERAELFRTRYQAVPSPLARARTLEKLFNDLGLIFRARVKGDQILLDCASTVVLKTALGRTEEVTEDFRDRVMQLVLERVNTTNQSERVMLGEELCAPATTSTPVTA